MNESTKFFIETTCTLNCLSEPYAFSSDKQFLSMEDAVACIKEEMQKIRSALKACSIEYHEQTRYASEEITTEFNGSCRWDIHCIIKNKAVKTPALFVPSQYIKETYGLKDISAYIEKSSEVPYYGLNFARNVNGTFRSYLIADRGVPFEESMAKKLLDDPKVPVGTHYGFIECDGETVRMEMQPATDYYLPYQNQDCVLFAPTVPSPIPDAGNVQVDFDLEVLFCFGEGLLVPIRKSYRTEGAYAISVRDAIEDILNALEGPFEEIDDFFSDSGNYHETEDGFTLMAFSAGGLYSELEFSDDRTDLYELSRALTSIRLVHMEERIYS